MAVTDTELAPSALLDVLGLDGGDLLPDDFADELVRLRRHLHAHPEVGMQEHATSRFIRQTLEQHGLDVQGPIAGGTGLFVDIGGAHPGPHVGYRADIDALPIQDAKQVAYASQRPGLAHLCGHDAHTTVAIGIALLLHRMREHLAGRVRVFFQPNEESMPSGAPLMIRDGVLDGLEAVYAIHVDPHLSVGQYGLIHGVATAAADRFDLYVRNASTGHSARPHKTGDTVWTALQITQALYGLPGRVTDARHTSVLTICRLRGGDAYNVIPGEVALGGTLRCTDHDVRQELQEKIREVARQTASLYGMEARVEFDYGAPPVWNEPHLIRNVDHVAERLFGEEAIHNIELPSMGAEDFSHYLMHVPGALIRVGTSSSPPTSYPLHDACFDIDEAALLPTVQLMSAVLVNHLRTRPLDA